MKLSNNALTFLAAQYRAIFKQAYFKGLASSIAVAALAAASLPAQAAALTQDDVKDGVVTVTEADKSIDTALNGVTDIVISGSGELKVNDVQQSATGSLGMTGGSLTITKDASNASISADTVNIGSSATVTLSGGATLSGQTSVDVKDSTLTLKGGSLTSNETLTLGTATITSSGANAIAGSSVNITGGTITQNDADSTLTISGASTVEEGDSSVFLSNVTVNNTKGTITFQGKGLSVDKGTITNAGTMNLGAANISDATITNSGTISGSDVVLNGSAVTLSGDSAAAFNFKTLKITGDTKTFSVDKNGTLSGSGISIEGSALELKATGAAAANIKTTTFNASGDSNKLTLGASGAYTGTDAFTWEGNSGSITAASGASFSNTKLVSITGDNNTVSFASGSTVTAGEGFTLSGAGSSLEIASGSTATGVAGTVTVNGGAEFKLASKINSESLDIAGAGSKLTLSEGAALGASKANVKISNGASMSNTAANTAVTIGGTLTLEGTEEAKVSLDNSSGKLTVTGAATAAHADIKGGTELKFSDTFSGDTVTITDATALEFGKNATFKSSNITGGTATTKFSGAFAATDSTIDVGTAMTVASGTTLNNSQITGGTSLIDDGSLIAVDSTIEKVGTLQFKKDSSLTNSTLNGGATSVTFDKALTASDSTISGGTAFKVSGAATLDNTTFNGGDSSSFAEKLTIKNGSTFNAGKSTTASKAVELNNSTLNGDTKFEVTEALTANNSTINVGSGLKVTGASTLTGGTLNFAASNKYSGTAGITLNGTTVNVTGTGATVKGDITINGGVFNVSDGADITATKITNSAITLNSGTINNSGTITLGGDMVIGGALNNAGTIALKAFSLKFTGDAELGGTLTADNGGKVDIANDKTVTVKEENLANTIGATNLKVKFGTNSVLKVDGNLASSYFDSDGKFKALESGTTETIVVTGDATLGAKYAGNALTAANITTGDTFAQSSGTLTFTNGFTSKNASIAKNLVFSGGGETAGNLDGSIKIDANGILDVASGTLNVANGGTVYASGGAVNIGKKASATLDITQGTAKAEGTNGKFDIGAFGSLKVKGLDVVKYDSSQSSWAFSDTFNKTGVTGDTGSVLSLSGLNKDGKKLSEKDLTDLITLISAQAAKVKIDFGNLDDVLQDGSKPLESLTYKGTGYNQTLASNSTYYANSKVSINADDSTITEGANWGSAALGEGVTKLESAFDISLSNASTNGGLFVSKSDGSVGDINQTDNKLVDLRGSGEIGSITTSGSVIIGKVAGDTAEASVKTGAISAEKTVSIADVTATDIASISGKDGVTLNNVNATNIGNITAATNGVDITNVKGTIGTITGNTDVNITGLTDATAGDISSTTKTVTIKDSAGTFSKVTATAEDVVISNTEGSFSDITASTAGKSVTIDSGSNLDVNSITTKNAAIAGSTVNVATVTADKLTVADSTLQGETFTIADSGSSISNTNLAVGTLSFAKTTASTGDALTNVSGTVDSLSIGDANLISITGDSAVSDKTLVINSVNSAQGKLKISNTGSNSTVYVGNLDSKYELGAGGILIVDNIGTPAAGANKSRMARSAFVAAPRAGATLAQDLVVPVGAALGYGYTAADLDKASSGIKKLLNGTGDLTSEDITKDPAKASRAAPAGISAKAVLVLNKSVDLSTDKKINVGITGAGTAGGVTLGDGAALVITKSAANAGGAVVTGTVADDALVKASGGAARIVLDDLSISYEEAEKLFANAGTGNRVFGDNITVTDVSGLFEVPSTNPPGGNGGSNGGVVIPPYNPETPPSDQPGTDNKPQDPFANNLMKHTSEPTYYYVMNIYKGGNLTELAKTPGGHYITQQVSNGQTPENVDATARMVSVAGTAQGLFSSQNALASSIAERAGFGSASGNVADNGNGTVLWLTPTYQNVSSSGFGAQGQNYGTDIKIGSVALGADYGLNDMVRVGGAFVVGDGSIDGKGMASSVKNDVSYFGFAAYGTYGFGNASVVGDISYLLMGSDVTQEVYGDKLTANSDGKALSLGVTGKYEFDLGNGFKAAPHAGLRFTNINLNDITIKGNNADIATNNVSSQNIVSIPVGVSFYGDLADNSAWSIRPNVDFTLTANTGDLDQKVTANFAGLSDLSVTTDTFDSFTYGVKAGLDASSGSTQFGIKVGYTGSSNVNEFTVNANIGFAF